MAPAGGSSRPLSSALAALRFMSSAGWTSATRSRPRCEPHVEEVGERAHLLDLDLGARLGVFLAGAASPSSGSASLRRASRARGAGSRDGCRRGTSGSRRSGRRASRRIRLSHSRSCAKRSASASLPTPRGPWSSRACGSLPRRARRASRGSAGSRDASERRGCCSSALRICGLVAGGVDDAHAPRLGPGARRGRRRAPARRRRGPRARSGRASCRRRRRRLLRRLRRGSRTPASGRARGPDARRRPGGRSARPARPSPPPGRRPSRP